MIETICTKVAILLMLIYTLLRLSYIKELVLHEVRLPNGFGCLRHLNRASIALAYRMFNALSELPLFYKLPCSFDHSLTERLDLE